MATFAIGDVQGCYDALRKLLEICRFDAHQDQLWLAGDVVNRGPQSLEVLRFLKSLPIAPIIVLGNHDLHLLAVAYGAREMRSKDTFQDILIAPDREELVQWLLCFPLLHHDAQLNYVMTHAGIAPCWDLQLAKACAREAEAGLQQRPQLFLQHLFGDEPNRWRDELEGYDRYRLIINFFTRMRFCDAEMTLDLSYKGEIAGKPAHLYPWFSVPNRIAIQEKILFGHWAALNGVVPMPNIYALDTGCAWGNCLTAKRLEDGETFQVKCA